MRPTKEVSSRIAEISIFSNISRKKDRDLYRNAVAFFLTRFRVDVANLDRITIELTKRGTQTNENEKGWCCPEPISSRKTFTIALAQRTGISLRLYILAHECAHLAQIASGRMRYVVNEDGDNCVRWGMSTYPPMYIFKLSADYQASPWEVEAEEIAGPACNAFFDYAIEQGWLTETTDERPGWKRRDRRST